jgi:hypothetical protein
VKVSLTDQIASVNREIGMRRRVYPGWVRQKKMTEGQADAEIAAMEAVAETLRALPGCEPAQRDLLR